MCKTHVHVTHMVCACHISSPFLSTPSLRLRFPIYSHHRDSRKHPPLPGASHYSSPARGALRAGASAPPGRPSRPPLEAAARPEGGGQGPGAAGSEFLDYLGAGARLSPRVLPEASQSAIRRSPVSSETPSALPDAHFDGCAREGVQVSTGASMQLLRTHRAPVW